MSEEYLILVDKDDNPIGSEEKVKCHLPNGILHRAFTALLFDKNGKLVLTRRAKEKMLWPGDWDGTVASHPRESETYVSSGERRMPEELGIECKLDYLFKFEYHVPYKDIGSENEVCGTLIGVVDESSPFKKIEGEIDEIKWISAEELLLELKSQPEVYCPWMIIALELLDKSEKSMLQKYENIFKSWMSSEMHEAFQQAIKLHLPDNNWRLVQ
ncbi:MAG: isopentenyl-diphosphate Delta-isomerase [Nitrosopumilaceae archaeon]|uniref:Isopentenyl-diphosphate Delta-isomerase n=1 Tax=Candidatus Nitrosomaritimum aestuariumsis TaxID=3342354 RepID=A0AC60VY34_9ARCH|nr:isopentenyl-diphosphate Delta-isomerase [Nitrosopumilaceae archaeon]MBA4460211.1 isopentenyl-diphosphate Delta-isomerase [Nitrosopumilaceae archaeon]MBA4461714.1 isopentenyl-diphosphate Delta-isomerase [Nitrosopumilaceae archaeon]